MKPRSAKAKGRKFQQYIRDTFRQLFKNDLDQDDINCTMMSESGIDIKLTPAAKKLIPFDIECKKQEKLNLNEALKQTEENLSHPDRIPTLIFTKNRSKVYVVIEFSKFIKLIYPEKSILISNEKVDFEENSESVS